MCEKLLKHLQDSSKPTKVIPVSFFIWSKVSILAITTNQKIFNVLYNTGMWNGIWSSEISHWVEVPRKTPQK